MSASEIPIDQNTSTGGEPLPNEETDNEVSEIALVVERTQVNNAADDDDDEDNDDEEDNEEDEDEEEEENFMDGLPKCVRERVEFMKKLNDKRDKIMEGYLKERAELEKKYSDLCKPLFAERAKIVIGEKDKEIAELISKKDKKEGEDGEDEGDQEEHREDDQNLTGVPEFWSCSMHNIEAISELVTERDNECLMHLENVTCDDYDDGKGFELRFYFKEDNPYFENRYLSKRYEIPNLLLDDEPILKNVYGCEIDWKPSMCLTFREVQKKQRSKSGKRAGQVRTVTKKERTDSFFHFFSPPKLPSMNNMDEDEADAIEEAFDSDYDVAQSFRSHIIPKAVMWFTGEAMEDEFERMMGDSPEAILSQMEANYAASESPFLTPGNNNGGTEEPECKQS